MSTARVSRTILRLAPRERDGRLSDYTDSCHRCGKLVGRKLDGSMRKHEKNGEVCSGVAPKTFPSRFGSGYRV